jgi:hypothetical protein
MNMRHEIAATLCIAITSTALGTAAFAVNLADFRVAINEVGMQSQLPLEKIAAAPSEPPPFRARRRSINIR